MRERQRLEEKYVSARGEENEKMKEKERESEREIEMKGLRGGVGEREII